MNPSGASLKRGVIRSSNREFSPDDFSLISHGKSNKLFNILHFSLGNLLSVINEIIKQDLSIFSVDQLKIYQ